MKNGFVFTCQTTRKIKYRRHENLKLQLKAGVGFEHAGLAAISGWFLPHYFCFDTTIDDKGFRICAPSPIKLAFA